MYITFYYLNISGDKKVNIFRRKKKYIYIYLIEKIKEYIFITLTNPIVR